MKADNQDQLQAHPVKKRLPFIELLLALGAAIALVALWTFWEDSAQVTAPSTQAPPSSVASSSPAPEPEPKLPATPDIPRREAPASQESTVESLSSSEAPPATETRQITAPTPLTTEQGEDLLREQLARANPESGLDILAGNERPLDATAALVDGLGRGLILRKILPTTPPQPGFQVKQAGDVMYLDPANYERFNAIAQKISSQDTAALAGTFHTLRPLLEGAYNNLGLDSGDFDNALIRTLDLVLATPEITEPITLKTKSVAYVYADPALESLPAVQKQLLRMGPDNIRLIKGQAQTLRDALLTQ